jgi:4-amino-4-deoxy-L-arabinose transferase-like glycosyltransferase
MPASAIRQAGRDDEPDRGKLPRLAVGVLLLLGAAKFLLHLFTSVRQYGYFRDELYYLDLARHLDWGYVDSAPLVAVYAKAALLMGGSLAALRIIPALAGVAMIGLTILIARELGGNRYAQFLAGLCVLLCPAYLVMGSLMTMNAFEPLYWMGCILLLARIIRTGNSRLWLWFGVLAGLGLENKHSTLFFGFAVTMALLLTQNRREFAKPWIWIAGAIAVAIFLPNVLWQVKHHFPTLEDLENVRKTGKNVVLGPLAFMKEQIIDMQPASIFIWLTGLIWLLRNRRWRVIGLTFVVFFITMEVAHGKNYYVFPIYPMLFAAGAIAIEHWLENRAAWTRAAVAALIIVTSIPLIPMSTWSLPPEKLLAYQKAIGFKPAYQELHHESLINAAYRRPIRLARDGAASCGHLRFVVPGRSCRNRHLAGNYGEAGAIDQFGPRYGLPTAYSRHQNLWYWGPPPRV